MVDWALKTNNQCVRRHSRFVVVAVLYSLTLRHIYFVSEECQTESVEIFFFFTNTSIKPSIVAERRSRRSKFSGRVCPKYRAGARFCEISELQIVHNKSNFLPADHNINRQQGRIWVTRGAYFRIICFTFVKYACFVSFSTSVNCNCKIQFSEKP